MKSNGTDKEAAENLEADLDMEVEGRDKEEGYG